jgi:predicted acylesterase/phospholipase RssA
MRIDCAALMGLVIVFGLNACADTSNMRMCAAKAGSAGGACEYDASAQTSYRFSPKPEKDTLVIVTLSGGGARASALGFGTLQMLDQLDGVSGNNADTDPSLLDQVDIISSVSGGSVMAGWYAMNGKSALATTGKDARLWEFLNTDWMAQLIWKGLNPWALARYTFTPYERNDVLSDFFNEHLFQGVTYDVVRQRYSNDPHQPYVILNATDLGHEAVFPFTQGHFDLLCSDLNKYRLANAVAASGNFPLAFSPLGLENFSGCDAQRGSSWTQNGPPQWIRHYDKFSGENAATPLSIQLNELRTARLAEDFLQSPNNNGGDRYVHLLDGGVTDNLGIRSTLAIEDDPARVPSLYLRLSGPKRPAGYQNIRRLLYIVVNARTRDPAGIDKHKAPSGEIKTAVRMVDTQLDASTLTDQDYLIAELEAMARGTAGGATTAAIATTAAVATTATPATANAATAGTAGESCGKAAAFLSCKPEAQANLPAPDGRLQFYVVSVDFEMIPDKACRDRAWLLKTNWGLGKHQARDIADIAQVIMKNSADLARFYKDLNKTPKALDGDKDFTRVCQSLAAHSN